MTRYRLIRLVQVSAAALGTLILGAGIRRLGLPSTVGVIAFCALGGAAASLGWHGVRFGFIRHEEHLQATRRHRAPRPDADTHQQAEARPEVALEAPAEDPREPDVEQAFAAFDARADAYLAPPPSARWYGVSPAAEHEDLYAHPGSPA